MKIKILQSKRVYMKFTEMIFIQLQVNKMVEQAVVAMMIMEPSAKLAGNMFL